MLLGNAGTRLTIVTAPAGWGKTTLLSRWAYDPAERRQVAWVSLDAADDEPNRFWAYVLTALQRIGIGSQALSSLGVPGVDPLTVAVPALLNELESAGVEAALVLDDYHVLSDPRVHEGVEFLLTYLPASLRLVISGRADPALPLPRLRASGELTEIRMHDLSSRCRKPVSWSEPSGRSNSTLLPLAGCASGRRAGPPGFSSLR
jgi:LuxR family maltose regulon positive regulatory protein